MPRGAWRPNSTRWEITPPHPQADELAGQLRTPPLIAQMLHNRGLGDPQAARDFLDPKLTDLHDPADLPGCSEAAGVIARAVAEKKRIVIYGDYDVDGITGVAILHALCRMLGADVHYYVPHRLEEGYGVNSEAIAKLAARGAQLLITVDCGITATGPLGEAVDAGIEVVVTDHHGLGESLPSVAAIVHPAIGGAYPNPHLAGAGAAFKLARQTARDDCVENRLEEPMRKFLLQATCLAALGTIADVVPLIGEHRVLAVHGLRALPASSHPGIRALLESAQLTGEELDAYHVGFVLAPRLNACGRMGHARLAVEMLTDVQPRRAKQIADYLNRQNTERQKVQRAITAEAMDIVTARGLDSPDSRVIVLASEDWHGGVIGIVASRLVDRFARPAVLVAFNRQGGQGSARSIPGFHMRDALAACSEHLLSFGGHAMAGGLRIERERIDAFTAAMADYAEKNISPEQLAPTLRIDAETTLAALSYNVVAHLERLAPFGQGNPPPVVAVRGCKVLSAPRRMGRNGQTVSLMLAQGDARLRAVGFGMGDLADLLIGVNTVDVAAEPVLNRFNGRTSVELKLKDVAWT